MGRDRDLSIREQESEEVVRILCIEYIGSDRYIDLERVEVVAM